jgi:hypothetical protein
MKIILQKWQKMKLISLQMSVYILAPALRLTKICCAVSEKKYSEERNVISGF